jgi:phosphoglycolate phosphatase
MTAPIIAFDLDGTLVDTAPDLVATLNVLLARKGLPCVEEATLRIMIGGGGSAPNRTRPVRPGHHPPGG